MYRRGPACSGSRFSPICQAAQHNHSWPTPQDGAAKRPYRRSLTLSAASRGCCGPLVRTASGGALPSIATGGTEALRELSANSLTCIYVKQANGPRTRPNEGKRTGPDTSGQQDTH